LFKDLGLIETVSSFDSRKELSQFASGWGGNAQDYWKVIYRNIETVTTFWSFRFCALNQSNLARDEADPTPGSFFATIPRISASIDHT